MMSRIVDIGVLSDIKAKVASNLRKSTDFDYILPLTSKDVVKVYDNIGYLFQIPFGMFLFVVIVFMALTTWIALGKLQCTSKLDDKKKFKLMIWILELIFCTLALVLFFVLVEPCVYINGTLFSGLRTGEWNDSWSERLNWINTVWLPYGVACVCFPTP